jgi:hypothetical protein
MVAFVENAAATSSQTCSVVSCGACSSRQEILQEALAGVARRKDVESEEILTVHTCTSCSLSHYFGWRPDPHSRAGLRVRLADGGVVAAAEESVQRYPQTKVCTCGLLYVFADHRTFESCGSPPALPSTVAATVFPRVPSGTKRFPLITCGISRIVIGLGENVVVPGIGMSPCAVIPRHSSDRSPVPYRASFRPRTLRFTRPDVCKRERTCVLSAKGPAGSSPQKQKATKGLPGVEICDVCGYPPDPSQPVCWTSASSQLLLRCKKVAFVVSG